ncbi:MAG: glycoside hydrolase family 13 protein [Clostridia bacterium]|nr:glycoside hydrolase family 13 protein [Clostridia bacterium]
MLLHNSHDPFFRDPVTPVSRGTWVTFRFQCQAADEVLLRTWDGREHFFLMDFDGDQTWEAKAQAPDTPMLWWYDFIIVRGQQTLRYGNRLDLMGGEGQIYADTPHSFQITVYDENFRTPKFLQNANIYQIFPDRFFKAPGASKRRKVDAVYHENWNELPLVQIDDRSGDNQATDFFGGTLTGIEQKLPYLKKLGVTALYLNPIFKARSNHRYDTGDYETIDPLLGNLKEFKHLCDAAKALGIRLILDGVFSHTGEDSRYFNRLGRYPTLGACQSMDSPYYKWFKFQEYPIRYKAWWGFPSLPEVDKNEPTYQQYMFEPKTGIVPRWIKNGASGWRLDVADELPMDFIRKLRQAAKAQDPEAVVLGEVWEDASAKTAYGELRTYCFGDTLDSVMNYPLREAIIAFVTGQNTAYDLCRLINHQREVYPPVFRYALMNLLGSHDRPRILNMLAGRDHTDLPRQDRGKASLTPQERELAIQRFKTAFRLLCALPGAPTVYYGDEAGMEGAADPFCRGPYPWGMEDANIRSFVQEQFNARLKNPVLRTGLCDVTPIDENTLRILRYTHHGKDALGRPMRRKPVELVIKR